MIPTRIQLGLRGYGTWLPTNKPEPDSGERSTAHGPKMARPTVR
jgi:hypothetical protein